MSWKPEIGQSKRSIPMALSVLLVALSIVAAGCGTEREPDMAEQMQARKDIGSQLDRLKERAEALRAQAQQAGQEIAERSEQQISDLEERTSNLREELDEVAEAGDEAWDEFVRRADSVIEQIGDALDDIADQLV